MKVTDCPVIKHQVGEVIILLLSDTLAKIRRHRPARIQRSDNVLDRRPINPCDAMPIRKLSLNPM